jgi:hypothetical protein
VRFFARARLSGSSRFIGRNSVAKQDDGVSQVS